MTFDELQEYVIAQGLVEAEGTGPKDAVGVSEKGAAVTLLLLTATAEGLWRCQDPVCLRIRSLISYLAEHYDPWKSATARINDSSEEDD